MPPRELRTPLTVVVLGMLSEEPLHVYGMRRRIQERAYDRLPGVKTTSLYDVVRRLEAAGHIHAEGTSREGGYPERTRFAITPSGRQALTIWVEKTFEDHADADGVPAALSFMYLLGREQVMALIEARVARITAALDIDDYDLTRAQGEGTNPIFLSEHHYQLTRRRAERDWLAGFVRDVKDGALTWPE